jgi:hypothetical protein
MQIRKLLMACCMTVGIFAMIQPAVAETTDILGRGQAIVTVLPLKNKNAPAEIPQSSLQAVVNGKESDILGWAPLRGPDSNLELVILIDGSARAGITLQYDDIAEFIRHLPADAKVAVGYMNAGRTVLSGPLSSDHDRALDELRIPAGVAGSNGSPYFCLSDLAQNWPSKDTGVRREVIMITDGVDNYYPGYSTEDPYLQASIRDSVRAGLVVYSIYTPNRGRADNRRYQSFVGQSLLTTLTDATGGFTYWDGTDRSPVSLRHFFNDIAQRLKNQFQLRFQTRLRGKSELQSMSLKAADHEVEIFAPQRVHVSPLDAE